MLSTLLLAALSASPSPFPQPAPLAAQAAPVQRYVAVELGTHPLQELLALDLDIATLDQQNGQARIIADDDDVAALEQAGFSPRVLIDDLTDFYAKRLEAPLTPLSAGSYGAWLNPQFSQGGMGGYYTLAQIESVLDQMTAAYPNLITARQSIGSSLQGRSQWMVKISDNPGSDENEPEVRFDALHHSREPQGMQTTLWFMLFLLEEYGSDPLATYLVNEREIYFVPCVNPDGYEYNRSIAPNGGGLWRKNRRNNGGGSFGVDLNRNYPYRWGFDNFGSSPDPNSEVYRGPSAASEPEVSNMVAFISGREFRTALSVHTFSDLWLSPWGYDELYPANWPQYDEVGTLATEFNGHPHGPASIILYEANGVTVDYDHGQHGTLSWTPEIGSSTDGFWPPQSRIVPLARENLEAFQRTALAGGPWVRMQDVTSTDVGDGDGSFEAGEGVEFVADLRNSGSVASGSVDLSLSTSSSAVTITTASTSTAAISAFSNGQNATPLALTVNAGTPSGTGVDLVLTVTYGGFSQDFPFEIVIGQQITLAAFDFEAGSDEGWSVGSPNNASTGNWVRVNPRGTNAQPEDDHTPNPGTTCWVTGQGSVGGSDGENDVDGGRTTLLSPIFDLDGRIAPRIRYWRWYSNDVGSSPNEDTLAIDLSNNGGSSWSSVEVIGPDGPQTSGGWFEYVFEVESVLPLTSQMRLRVIASDLGSGSIVEAALDDVAVTYFEDAGCPPATNYCTSSANSAGAGSVISSTGSTLISANDFGLRTDGNPANQFGVFFMGENQVDLPFGNGRRCASGNVTRFPLVQANGAGTATYAVDVTTPPALGKIVAGSTWQWQFWYRDPMGGGANFNTSDGLTATYCP